MRLKYEKVIHHAVVNNLFGLGYTKKSCNAQGSSKYYLFVTASFLCDEIILVDASQTGIQWSSAEHLISYPTAYRYAIALNYNTACTPGAGSAIFLHCSTGGATAGCISVSSSDMIRILKMLQGDTLIGIYQNKSSLY